MDLERVDRNGARVDDLTRLDGVAVRQSDIEYRQGLEVMRSPSDCTNFLKFNWPVFSKLPPKMVLTSESTSTEAQRAAVAADLPTIFPPLPKSGDTRKPVALILWRNAATSGGPYPELNTGVESLAQMSAILTNLGITPAVVDVGNGDERAKIKAIHPPIMCSDKAYYKADSLKPDVWTQPKPHSSRDVEAYFIQQAYQQGYFHCAIGMRSGALD